MASCGLDPGGRAVLFADGDETYDLIVRSAPGPRRLAGRAENAPAR